MSKKSLLAIAALATTVVDQLNVVALQPPQWEDEFFTCTGLLDSDSNHWVAIYPHNSSGEQLLDKQVKFLLALSNYKDAHRIFFEVPRPRSYLTRPAGEQLLIYQQLPGTPLDFSKLEDNAALATQVGKALANLHEVPPNLAEHAGFDAYTTEQIRQDWQEKIDDAATSGKIPPALLQRWEQALEDVAWWRFRSTTIHADLGPSHIYVNTDHVLALSGFSSTRVGDPAQDLAWVVAEADFETMERVLASYHLNRTEGADPYLRQRAELYGELALVSWLRHGLNKNDPHIIDDAAQMLSDLAQQLASPA